VEYFRYFRAKSKIIFQNWLDRLILLLPIYYTDLDKICLKYWFDVINGKLSSLYKIKLFKRIPAKFDEIVLNMMFQMDNLNCEMINKKAELAILRSIAIRTKNKSIQFQADVLANEINNKQLSANIEKNQTLNQFIDYIEITLESIGMIDPYKMKASRAFSLYQKAIDKNKHLNELYSKKNT